MDRRSRRINSKVLIMHLREEETKRRSLTFRDLLLRGNGLHCVVDRFNMKKAIQNAPRQANEMGNSNVGGWILASSLSV